MPQRAIRFSETTMRRIDTVTRERGFASPTAFIRYAVEQELSDRQDGLTGAEERIAATLGQVRKDVLRVARAQQALFAYVDTLAKALLPVCRSHLPTRDLKPWRVPKNAMTGLSRALDGRWSASPGWR